MRKILVSLLAIAMIVCVFPFAVNAELQNYALNCPVEVSGVENDTYLGPNAVDGNMETRWASDYVDNAYIIVDLGAPKPIGYIALYWEAAYAVDFSILLSSDGTSWDTKVETTGNSEVNLEYSFDLTTARYVKIECYKRATEYGNSLYEIVVSESIDAEVKTEVAGYPSSGVAVPEGSVVLSNAVLIGNETGWGENADAGRAAAFDGNSDTFFDPLGVGDGYAGIDVGKEFILTKIAILPRNGQLPRFLGGSIQGSNDEENWTDLFVSDAEATEFTWQEITDISNNTGYRYFRYYNTVSHGDVADVELYGYAKDGSTAAELAAAKEAAAASAETEAAAVAETPVAEEAVVAPATADFTSAIVMLAIISAAGVVVCKKRK